MYRRPRGLVTPTIIHQLPQPVIKTSGDYLWINGPPWTCTCCRLYNDFRRMLDVSVWLLICQKLDAQLTYSVTGKLQTGPHLEHGHGICIDIRADRQ